MQPYRLGDGRPEPPAQEIGAEHFVAIVDAALGWCFSQIVDHMADVVQQRRDHQGLGVPSRGGERRALQGMLELRDRIEPVSLRSAFGI
jgi:hypothetical protein